MTPQMEELTEWILRFESGRTWYNKLVSDHTKKVFLRRLKLYCNGIRKNPDKLIELKVEGLKAVNTPEEFQAEESLENFLNKSRLTPNMKKGLKIAVLSFYTRNRRSLEPDTAENIDVPEPKKRRPKTCDLIELENGFTYLRDKALLWFVASAPFRDGTIPLLLWGDLKATNDPEIPYYLIIDSSRLKGKGIGKYKGLKQICFIHYLASEKLDGYRKELSWKGYTLKEDDPIFITYKMEGEIKPLSRHSIDSLFAEASLRAWHDLKKKRFSPQNLRSFVQSVMENANINSNMIAPILGYKVKGVDFHYSEHDVAELMEKFRLALPYLLPENIENVKATNRKALSQHEDKLKQAQYRIEELERQIEELPTGCA